MAVLRDEARSNEVLLMFGCCFDAEAETLSNVSAGGKQAGRGRDLCIKWGIGRDFCEIRYLRDTELQTGLLQDARSGRDL